MKRRNLLGPGAALALVLPLAVGATAQERHSPDAHMDQNAERYRYTYDDGVCQYDYRYDFKDLTDHLEEHGDCRDVPIERYRPQAASARLPTYPPPASAPPAAAPGIAAPAAPAPSVTVERPWPVVPPASR